MSPNPLDIIAGFNPKTAWPGMTMLMVSTTGEQHAFYRLDDQLRPVEAELPANLRESVERITENCEPALCSVLFMAGAGGSLRAGVTENPVRLTRSVRQALTTVTAGGAPVYVWPGGGITFMVDVTLLPRNAFGYVPTPALGGADRIHAPARRLRGARRPCRRSQILERGRRRPRRAADQRVHRRRRRARGPGEARVMREPPQIRAPAGRAPPFPRRADRSDHRGFRRTRRGRGGLCKRRAAVSRPSSTNSARNCRCCARPRRRLPPRPEGVVARRMAAAVAPFRAHRFITPMAAVAGAVAEEVLAAMTRRRAVAARLCQQRRRHRAASGRGRFLHDRHGRAAGPAEPLRPRPRSSARRRARRRDLRLARAQLLARRRRRRHRAGAERRARRRRRDADRQRGRPSRSSRHHARARARARSAERSRRPAGHARGRRLWRPTRSAGRSTRARARPSSGAARA